MRKGKKSKKSAEKESDAHHSQQSDKQSKKKRKDEGVVFRPRKLDKDRKLLILRQQDLDSIETLRQTIKSHPLDRHFKGNITIEEFEKLQEICLPENESNQQESSEGEKQILNIPVPSFREIPNLQNAKKNPFVYPNKYITFDEAKQKFEIALEYDMREEDEKFLDEFNKNRRYTLSELNFERIYAILLRYAPTQAGFLSFDSFRKMAKELGVKDSISLNEFLAVRSHWIQQNEKVIKELEEKEEILANMQYELKMLLILRQDFERLRILLELCRKREKLKTQLVQTTHEEFKILSKQNGTSVNDTSKKRKRRNESNSRKPKRTRRR